MSFAPTTAKPGRSASRAPRLTVTSLPSLNPVTSAQLVPFFDTVFAIAQRLVEHEHAPATAA